MNGINRVELLGNLGKDPEVREIEGGIKVVSFPLATTDMRKNEKGEKVEHTEWHEIVAWRGMAELIGKMLTKGSRVMIIGSLRQRSWVNKEGEKKYKVEVIVEQFYKL